jgi:hypothetical protein
MTINKVWWWLRNKLISFIAKSPYLHMKLRSLLHLYRVFLTKGRMKLFVSFNTEKHILKQLSYAERRMYMEIKRIQGRARRGR